MVQNKVVVSVAPLKIIKLGDKTPQSHSATCSARKHDSDVDISVSNNDDDDAGESMIPSI